MSYNQDTFQADLSIKPDFYRDGICYCGYCRTPKETRVRWLDGEERIVSVSCKCQRKENEERMARIKETDRVIRISALRTSRVQSRTMIRGRFENARNTPQLEKCRKYVRAWGYVLKNGVGILMWGTVGTGKTYAASCIANALMDKNVPVLSTSIPRICNANFADRDMIIQSMKWYDLILLDDIGVERDTAYSLETVYNVINELYMARKPVIVTTNMTIGEIKRNAHDESSKTLSRIYDRILAMCVPMKFDGQSYREQTHTNKTKIMTKVLSV